MSSSASIVSSLANVSLQINLYLGQTVLIAGVIGGILNLIVFLSLKTFRQSSCAYYLIIMSYANLGQLLIGCLSRVLITGYNIDWSQTSLIFCKLRWYLFQMFTLVSYAYMCFATIDQYIATSIYRQWHRVNNIKFSYCFCLGSFIFAILHGIPAIIYTNHIISPMTNKIVCTITNPIFLRYRTYGFNAGLAGALPVFITVFFGSLAYRNVQQIAYRTVPIIRRELDKQLTSMVLVQVVCIFMAITPYTIVIIIMTNIDLLNNPIVAAQLGVAESLTAVMYYSYFATPFYIYIIVSKRFRQQLIHVLSRLFSHCNWQPITHHNQVVPEIQTN